MKKKAELVRKIVAEVLEVEESEVFDETDLVEELDADSMMALEIVALLEKELKITIPEELLEEMTSVNSILKLLEDLKTNVG
ncbi:acyl carrier protein [Aquibacillus sp. 3ASR75-11]|uniref:Acyl carrier protein n=1 Tax=Terrihalobacillus insolitus TaxID=2950438 RepID=A0A9X3WTC3_9BACI|nr:acyl carrier protein [Terrihalobacillus insolitus]MDC3425115.1 acyl carrier protein [Terrihalobacillus insolitus]